MSKTAQAAPVTFSSVAIESCLLGSQMSQRGRQVKFLSKKSSLQVKLTNVFDGGSMVVPNMADEPIEILIRNFKILSNFNDELRY